jgi:hypothetical protein
MVSACASTSDPTHGSCRSYVTAGDAGLGLGNGGRSQPYYLARENGAKLSVKFMADAAKAPEIPVESVASVSGHPIKRWLYRNTGRFAAT